MDLDQLAGLLTSSVDLSEERECEGDELMMAATVAVPLAANTIGVIVLAWLREYGCEHKDEIVTLAKEWIAANIRRPLVAAFCNFAVDLAAQAACPGS